MAAIASTKLPATVVAKAPTKAVGGASQPLERAIDVSQDEILDLLIRHQDLTIVNATLVTAWPLLDDMADVLMKIIGRRVE